MTSDPASLERRHLAELMTAIQRCGWFLDNLLAYCSQQLNVQPIDSDFNTHWPRIAAAYQ